MTEFRWDSPSPWAFYLLSRWRWPKVITCCFTFDVWWLNSYLWWLYAWVMLVDHGVWLVWRSPALSLIFLLISFHITKILFGVKNFFHLGVGAGGWKFVELKLGASNRFDSKSMRKLPYFVILFFACVLWIISKLVVRTRLRRTSCHSEKILISNLVLTSSLKVEFNSDFQNVKIELNQG